MSARTKIVSSFAALLMLASAVPALADGPVIITHAKALAGNVTPGDGPGYPVTLNKGGSYQLGGNLAPGAGKTGIVIAAGNVAIDFDGFTLTGSSGGAIGVSGKKQSATIRNGTITGMAENGIHAEAAFWVVENMMITNNGDNGVYSVGYLRMQNSSVAKNGGFGVYCTLGCLIENSIIAENQKSGVFVGGGTILGNTIVNNSGPGIKAASTARSGYGNNTIDGNNHGGPEVSPGQLFPLHPNSCGDASCS